MRIRWHGHACFEIGDEKTIITDPHDGKSIGIPTPNVRPDIVLVSHDHFDHNCVSVVKGKPEVVKGTGERVVNGTRIVGIPSYHDDAQGSRRGKNTIFVMELEGFALCHLGDLGHMLDDEVVAKIGKIDILFVPVGGVFTIDAQGAWKVVRSINPKVVIPMHYKVGGLSLSIQSVKPFLKKAKEVIKVGTEIEICHEDIPEVREVWSFSL